MPIPRLTIARVLAWTAVVALDAALVRAYLVAEMFIGAILLLATLQLALWRSLRTAGRRRRFWLGGVGAGSLAILALIWAEVDPDSPPARLLRAYVEAASGWLFAVVPAPWDEALEEHWAHVLAITYFLPELAVVLAGALLSAAIPDRWPGKAGRRLDARRSRPHEG